MRSRIFIYLVSALLFSCFCYEPLCASVKEAETQGLQSKTERQTRKKEASLRKNRKHRGGEASARGGESSANDAVASKGEASSRGDRIKFSNVDPLIPQSFAFDKTTQIFAGVNLADNAVDIVEYNGEGIKFKQRFVVDIVAKRHDIAKIYRPQSVAIYEGFVLILATQSDSSYLAVLNRSAEEIKRFYFLGNALAFSYDPYVKELYIAGDNKRGYDMAVLDASEGMDNLKASAENTFHYSVPKKSEEMGRNDSSGLILTVIAVSVVFIVLMLLYISFKGVGLAIMAFNKSRAMKSLKSEAGLSHEEAKEKAQNIGDTSADEYAAIAAAIFMYQNELHDEENTIITIEKVSRTYSPWSSKIYNMNTYFQNKNAR